MPQEYFIFDDNEKKTQQVSKDEYESYHKEKYEDALGSPEDQKQATRDYFDGIRSNTKVVLPQRLEVEREVGTSYKNRLTDDQRRFHFSTPQSEIGRKRANAESIISARRKYKESVDNNIKKVLKGNVYNNKSLNGIAAFFSGNKKIDTSLAADYLLQDQDKAKILERFIGLFLEFPLENLDISTDRDFADNAPILEKLSAQHDAIVNLVAENRTTYDNLPDNLKKQFEAKIGETNGLVNYYRLMSEVLTNTYYVTHENNELSNQKRETDTDEQKHLYRLLTQSKAGLLALKNFGAREMDRRLNRLEGNFSKSVVKKELIDLQRDIAERKMLLKKMEFSQYLDHLERKGSIDGMKPGKAKGVFDRAKLGIDRLKLHKRAEDGADSVIGILNQLEFVNTLTKQKQNYQNTFYLENDYCDIYIMEKVEKLSGPLRTMKNAILSMVNISEDGQLKTDKKTKSQKNDQKILYSNALDEYNKIMDEIIAIRNGEYLELSEDKERMDALVKHVERKNLSVEEQSRLHVPDKKEEEALRNQIDDLYLTLAENEYSDISFYRNAAKILNLFNDSKSFLKANEYNQLSALAEVAYEIALNKRNKDLDRAFKRELIIPKADLKRLKEEKKIIKEKLSPKNKQEIALRERNLENYRNKQIELRLKAQKEKFDNADKKAAAAYYMHQEQWTENSKKGSKGNFITRFFRSAASGMTRFVGWLYSKTRSNNHGEMLYDRSRDNLHNLPHELNDFGRQNANLTITHGDGVFAPKVDINTYFKDDMKLQLSGDYDALRGLMDDNVEYPQCIRDAVEAIGYYSQVKGVVNNDTFEMEQAFLDKFRKSVDEILRYPKVASIYPELLKRIVETNKHLEDKCGGTLWKSISKAELEAAKEMTAIYTTKTYFGDTEDSNVRDLPLFPHSPQLNDLKQGVLGNCYMLGAIQALVAKKPEAIQEMFYDLGDGDVIVRFYAPYGEVDGQYVRVDTDEVAAENVKMKPVYVKVRKHYTTGEEGSSCCLWMQLLEKAYAAAGFNQGHPEIDKNGELHNLNDELTAGTPEDVLLHLTGERYVLHDKKSMKGRHVKPQNELAANKELFEIQKRILFKGVPGNLHKYFYDELVKEFQDSSAYATDKDWIKTHVETAVSNAIKTIYVTVKEIEKAFKKLVDNKKITEEDKDNLLLQLYTIYNGNQGFQEDYVKHIVDNMSNPQQPDYSREEDFPDIKDLKKRLNEAMKDENVNYEKLFNVMIKREVIYDEAEELAESDVRKLSFATENIMVPNPNGYYKQKEIGYLRLLREMMVNGKAVPLASNNHAVTALDVKLYNNRWFVLIRDPFNSYRYEYTQKENGKVDKNKYGFFSAVGKHRAIKRISSNLKDGFNGTSWWELKDVYNSFDNFVLEHK